MSTALGPVDRVGRVMQRVVVASTVLAVAMALTATPAGAASTTRAPVPQDVAHATLHVLRGRLAPSGAAARSAAEQDSYAISTNWSGQVATGGTYTGVTGDWTVPAVPAGQSATYSSTWIGIDGTSASTLLQEGTTQASGSGGTLYFPWFEMLPNSVSYLPQGDAVAPGDAVTASITRSGASSAVWTLAMADTTRGWSWTKQEGYTTPGASAEWIEEAPTVDGTQTTLDDYGSVAITHATVTGPGTASAVYTPVYLENTGGTAIVSWPTAFDAVTSSFTVRYGSPTPVVDSVSPASGPTSGDTVVTLSGQYLFAASTVAFGGVATTDLYDDVDGSVTVAAPPHAAGTVQLVLTSADTSSSPGPSDEFTYSATAPRVPHGYWLVGGDGGIFSFGAAGFHGSTGSLVLQRPVVGITPTADRGGYWLVASDGGVFAFGDAGYYGSLPGLGFAPAGSAAPHPLDAPVVGMVPSTDDHGYFMVAADGGVFAFGDARYEGSCPGSGGCSGSAVSVLPDASGHGYWLVTATGYVYTFGDAPDEGDLFDYTGGETLGSAVTSAVRTPDGEGYWIVLADGAVAAFGDANFYLSPSGSYDAYGFVTGADPATAIFATGDRLGYWIASADGAVYGFGSAPDDGSMAGRPLNAPIIAATGW